MKPASPPRLGGRRRGLSLVSTLLLLIVVVAALYYFRGHHPGRARHGATADSETVAVDCRPIEGEWLRPDTGVVLEISGADRPGPISVWCSGCTYRLTYDDGSDRLIGSYQDSEGKRRDALFIRQK